MNKARVQFRNSKTKGLEFIRFQDEDIPGAIKNHFGEDIEILELSIDGFDIKTPTDDFIHMHVLYPQIDIEILAKGYAETTFKFDLDDEVVEFTVYQNLSKVSPYDIEAAFTNWSVRTDEFTAESLCEYIMSKSHVIPEVICLTKREIDALLDDFDLTHDDMEKVPEN